MKNIKLLLLTVAAALAAVALVGPSAASAEILCASSEAPCPAEDRYTAGTDIAGSLASGSKFSLTLIPAYTVTCTESSLTAETTESWGSPIPAKMNSLETASCTSNFSPGCGAPKGMNLPSNATLGVTSAPDGVLVSTGNGKLVVTCDTVVFGFPVKFTCEYGLPTLTVEGGNPAQLVANKAKLTKLNENSLCGSKKEGMELTATYDVDSPGSLNFITGYPVAPNALCDKEASPCPGGSQYPVGTELDAELTGKLTVEQGIPYTFSCGDSSIDGTVEEEPGLSISFTSMTAFECSFGTITTGECNAKWKELPYSARAAETSEGKTGGDWYFYISDPQLEIDCQTSLGQAKCVYESEGAETQTLLDAGTTPKLNMVLNMERLSGNLAQLCKNSAVLKATYEFDAPLFVAPAA